MAEKTYKSAQPRFSTHCFAGGKRVAISFTPHVLGGVHGEYATADPAVQAHIEKLHVFGRSITVKTDGEHATDKAALESKVAAAAPDRKKHEETYAARVKSAQAQTVLDKVVQQRNAQIEVVGDTRNTAHKHSLTEKASIAAKKAKAKTAAPAA